MTLPVQGGSLGGNALNLPAQWLVAESHRFGDHKVEISQNIGLVDSLLALRDVGSAMRVERIDHYFCAVGQRMVDIQFIIILPHRAYLPRAFDVINHHFLPGYVLIRLAANYRTSMKPAGVKSFLDENPPTRQKAARKKGGSPVEENQTA